MVMEKPKMLGEKKKSWRFCQDLGEGLRGAVDKSIATCSRQE